MKAIVFLSVFVVSLCLMDSSCLAQIGFNSVSPASCSVLDLSSMKKGVLLPRHDSIGVATLSSTPPSLLLFNKKTNSFCYFDSIGSQSWKVLNPWYSMYNSPTTILQRSSGNVGINTLTPGFKLTINDSVRFTNLRAVNTITCTGAASSLLTVYSGSNITVGGTVTADKFIGEGTVPKSTPILWYGKLSELPDGWSVYSSVENYIYIPDGTYQFNTGSGGTSSSKSSSSIIVEKSQQNTNNFEKGVNDMQLYVLIKND